MKTVRFRIPNFHNKRNKRLSRLSQQSVRLDKWSASIPKSYKYKMPRYYFLDFKILPFTTFSEIIHKFSLFLIFVFNEINVTRNPKKINQFRQKNKNSYFNLNERSIISMHSMSNFVFNAQWDCWTIISLNENFNHNLMKLMYTFSFSANKRSIITIACFSALTNEAKDLTVDQKFIIVTILNFILITLTKFRSQS
ncbi:hypothetical protein BpHYR1_043422 [Brachionus plicatilis]|uniref:Uncharacterized protein n=1 Tax=Brachionus plicatilis TaxID=10195 RepID=A0A3M7QBX3_BRAPC|nr:hypothetical protein BpHYR1_043422 [Brachionus plicatilis]